RVQGGLDLARVDVLAAADDHVLQATDNVDITVVIQDGEVAGVHPASLVDGGPRGGGVVPVAAHDAVAARAELPRRAARQDGPRGRVAHADLDVRHNAADRG